MKRLRRILRSQRGDLLIDSMLGVVLITLIMVSASGVLVVAATSSIGVSTNTSRAIVLNSVLSDAKPLSANYTSAPTTVPATAQNRGVSAILWREDRTPTLTVLHAATYRHGSQASDCTDPSHLDAGKCLQSEIAVVTSQSGVAATPVPLGPGTGGALFDLTAPATATELRYIVKVTAAPADSTLSFVNKDHPEVTFDVSIPSGQSGYYYGRVLVNGGSKLGLVTTGPATYDAGVTMIYEEPK